MKTYVDLTNTQLRKECVKIVEKVIGIKPLLKQIILLEASEDRVYFECGNITIDHRDYSVCGVHDFVEVIHGKGDKSLINKGV
jgi:hypothetical protein